MTEPEPINHNELKRLLIEVVDDLVTTVTLHGKEPLKVSAMVRRVTRKIENAILDGDDS